MSKREILFVTQNFPLEMADRKTGGAISNYDFLKTLSENNNVNVLSFVNGGNNLVTQLGEIKVTTRPFPNWRGLGLMINWQNFVKREVSLYSEKHPNLQYVMAASSTLAAFSCEIPQVSRIAIIRAYENFGLRCNLVPLHSRVKLTKLSATRRFQDGTHIRRSDLVITNSEFMKLSIHKRFNFEIEKIKVLNPFVAITPRDKSSSRTIGFVSRGKDKGIEFVKNLANIMPNNKFLIYGSDEIDAGNQKNISICGWVGCRDRMFSSANIWIVPSQWAEPFGRVSIEAQAAGRAVLVSSKGGLSETVFDEYFKIDGFDVSEWASRLKFLSNLPEESLAQNGAKVREAFSKNRHDRIIRDIFI